MTTTDPEVDGRLGVVVAELSGEVLRLRQRLDAQAEEHAAFVAALRDELRTGRIIVAEYNRRVEITPGHVDVDQAATPGDPLSGSFVHLSPCTRAGVVTVGSATGRPGPPDSDLTVTVYSGSEMASTAEAYVEVKAFDENDSLGVSLTTEAEGGAA